MNDDEIVRLGGTLRRSEAENGRISMFPKGGIYLACLRRCSSLMYRTGYITLLAPRIQAK